MYLFVLFHLTYQSKERSHYWNGQFLWYNLVIISQMCRFNFRTTYVPLVFRNTGADSRFQRFVYFSVSDMVFRLFLLPHSKSWTSHSSGSSASPDIKMCSFRRALQNHVKSEDQYIVFKLFLPARPCQIWKTAFLKVVPARKVPAKLAFCNAHWRLQTFRRNTNFSKLMWLPGGFHGGSS